MNGNGIKVEKRKIGVIQDKFNFEHIAFTSFGVFPDII
jgi:hypothetical protein